MTRRLRVGLIGCGGGGRRRRGGRGEADRMISAAAGAGVTLATVFQRRFFPAAQRIRRAIDAGRLGRLTMGECFARLSRSRAYFDRDAWRGTWDAEGGGALMNQAVH